METSRERCEEQSAVKKERQATPNPPPQRQTEIDRSHVLHTKRLYWFGRRAQDIVLSLIALLILWPLMLIVALVIWIEIKTNNRKVRSIGCEGCPSASVCGGKCADKAEGGEA